MDFVVEFDDFEGFEGAAFAFARADAGDFEGEDDVVEDGVVTVHEEGLKDKTEFAVAEAVEATGGQLGCVGAVKFDGARSGLVEQGKEVHEGGFAAAGFADDGDGFAGVDFQIDVAEGLEGGGFFAVGFVEVFGL